MSNFNRYQHPKAQKEYRCAWCGEMILVDEVHAHYIGVWDGEWQNWRMHEECFDDASTDDGISDGFMLYEAERSKKGMVQND